MNNQQDTPSGREARPLTRELFIKLAQPEFTAREAKIAYNSLARYKYYRPGEALDVYCPDCQASFIPTLCDHVSLDDRGGKSAPAIEPCSLTGFVAVNELRDLRGINTHRARIISRVVEALRGEI